MPSFQVRTAGSTSLTALVNGDEQIVVKLEERDNTLTFAIGAGNVATGAANRSPTATQSAGPLGQIGVLGDAALHDAFD